MEEYRFALIRSILTVLAMKPVIEAGIITLIPPKFHFCDSCGTLALGEMDRVREAVDSILESNFSKFSAEAESTNSFLLKGPDEYVEHGGMFVQLRRRPSWLPRGRKTKLTKVQLQKSGLVNHIFEEMAKSVIFQQLCAPNMKTKLLTNLPGEAEILGRLVPQDAASTRVASLCAALAHELPLMSDVPLRKVLDLRQEQPAAFEQYRIALSSVLNEYVEEAKPVNPRLKISMIRESSRSCWH